MGPDEVSGIDLGLVAAPDSFDVSVNDESPQIQRVVARLRNASHKPSHIIEVKSSCGCTVPDRVPAQPVPPGKSLELPLAVSPPGVGTKQILVSVTTDSTVTPTVSLRITAYGTALTAPCVMFGPKRLQFTGKRPGEVVEQELTIQTVERRDEPPWIIGAKSQADWLTVKPTNGPETERSIDDMERRTYRILLMAKVPRSEQSISTALDLKKVYDGSRAVAPVWVTAAYSPPLRAIPSLLNVRFGADESTVERTVLIVASGLEEWNCKVVDGLPAGVTVVEKQTSDDKQHATKSLRVSFEKSLLDAADQRMTLRFLTGVEEQPVIELPVTLIR